MVFSKRISTAVKVQAPKRVIRAMRNYVARESAELTFKKEDFFYVLSTPHDNDQWYDVSNPLTGERGLVPASYFEVMESRQERINRINRSDSNASPPGTGLSSSYSAGSTLAPQFAPGADLSGRASLGIPHNMPAGVSIYGTQRIGSNGKASSQRRPSDGHAIADSMAALSLRTRTASIRHQEHQRKNSLSTSVNASTPMLVMVEPRGTALYGFDAANGNELTVHEGDDLLVVAQSTEDWLIAKHATGNSNNGVAGLVPASYIQLRDHISGAVVSDLQAYLTHNSMRLRTAVEWDRHERDKWTSSSTNSSVSTISDVAKVAGNGTSGTAVRSSARTGSPASSTYDDDQSSTPRSSIGSIPGGQGITIQKSRTRALTTSSSTSSIAERSSFRQLHKGHQPSGSSLQHMSSENLQPFAAHDVEAVNVPSFICKDGAYLFQVSLKLYSGEERNLYRSYDDFICCRNQLHDSFPKATSPLKLARFSMHSSSMLYLNDAIAERRRAEINEYINGLLHDMPDEVVESHIVQQLLGSRKTTNHANHASLENSNGSQQPQHLRQSQIQALDRGMRHTLQPSSHPRHTPTKSSDSTLDSAFTPASASSTETAVEDVHRIYAKGLVTAPIAKSKSLDPKSANTDFIVPTARQLAHNSSMAGLTSKSPTVKVKVKLGNDMVAIRLPSELTLAELKVRLAEKIGSGGAADAQSRISQIMYHAPSGEAAPLSDDQDWTTALTVTNYKPVLTIVQ
ncbi:bud emergence protein 1 [Coemansia sp. RSA 2399]|nr:bud emergence protein 1 [Coemansia sp. RSA 2399]KAJ1904020.1 bud emergence protein 1 [Coemansia sp. IMI 209127]